MNPLDRPPHHGGGAAAGVSLMRRRVLLGVAVASPALAQGQGAGMRMVVPFPPGGATDVFARRLAGRMAAVLGQAVVVENRGGAAGAIGTLEAVRARPPRDVYHNSPRNSPSAQPPPTAIARPARSRRPTPAP